MPVTWPWTFGRCRRVRRQLSLLACGGLIDAEREVVQAHLGQCEGCRQALASFERVTRALTALARPAVTARPSASCGERWEQAVRASARPLRAVSRPERTPGFKGGQGLWLAHPAAALAVVWMCILGLHLSAPRIPATQAPPPSTGTPRLWLALRATPTEYRRFLHGEIDVSPAPKPERGLPPRTRGRGTNSTA